MTVGTREDADGLLMRLDALERRQQATEAALQRLTGLLLTSAQRRYLRALLAAVAGVYGSEAWTVRELCMSVAPGIVLTRRGLRAERLGRLLALAADLPIDDYVLTDAGLEHGARVWSIERRVGSFAGQPPQPSSGDGDDSPDSTAR